MSRRPAASSPRVVPHSPPLRAVRYAAIALGLLAGSVLPASAQPSPGTTFLSAGGFAAVERAPSTDGPGYIAADADGTIGGGLLGVGVHLTDRLSARVEGTLTGWLDTEGPPYAYPVAASTGSLSLVRGFEQARRTQAWFTTLGYQVGSGRVRLEPVAGLGLVNDRLRTNYDVRILAASSSLPAPASRVTTSTWQAVAVVGADVRVALTEHAAVVPQVRAYAAQGGLSVRPGIGVRWTF